MFFLFLFSEIQTSELIVIHLPHELSRVIDRNNVGLHRDDCPKNISIYNWKKLVKYTQKFSSTKKKQKTNHFTQRYLPTNWPIIIKLIPKSNVVHLTIFLMKPSSTEIIMVIKSKRWSRFGKSHIHSTEYNKTNRKREKILFSATNNKKEKQT